MGTKMEQGKKVNRTELAELCGIAMTTVDAWVRAGCPYVQRAGAGRGWLFNTAEVMRWREQRAAEEAGGDTQDEAALRLRKLRAETISAELDLEQKKGQLAPLDQIERVLTRLFAEIQTNLRGSLVTRLAVQLIGETDERKFKRVALSEIDIVLKSLANLDVMALAEEADEAADNDDDGGDL